MAKQRNRTVMQIVKEQGFYGVYVVAAKGQLATKIGVSQDPVRRFSDIQSANWNDLRLHAYWWTPGRPLAVRIEAAVLHVFAQQSIRGEWIRAEPEVVAEAALAHGARIKSIMQTHAELEQWVDANWMRIATR